MAVLTVVVLWCIVSVMAALSLGRFFLMSGQAQPVPIAVRRSPIRADAQRFAADKERRRAG